MNELWGGGGGGERSELTGIAVDVAQGRERIVVWRPLGMETFACVVQQGCE